MKGYIFIVLFILSIFNFAFSQKIIHKVLIDNLIGNEGYGFSVLCDDKGRIYVAGNSDRQNKIIVFVIRLDNEMNIDKTFGDNGKVFIGFSRINFFNSIAFDKEKIYVVGNIRNEENNPIFITRLNEDGSIDKSFGNYGKVILDKVIVDKEEYSYDLVKNFSVKDGVLYLAGTLLTKKNTLDFLIKLDQLGNIDESFGNKGIVLFDSFSNENYGVSNLCVDSNKNLLVVGTTYDYRSGKDQKATAFIMELKQNGSIDRNFGNNGKVIFPSLSDTTSCFIFINQDGNIYIGGNYWNENQKYDAFIIKIRNDGSFDKNFGNQGMVLITGLDLRKIFVNQEGKILVLAANQNNSYLLKLNDDGTVDKNFGKNGKIIIDKISNYDQTVALDFVVDKNDNIFVTGWTGDDDQKYPFLIKIEK